MNGDPTNLSKQSPELSGTVSVLRTSSLFDSVEKFLRTRKGKLTVGAIVAGIVSLSLIGEVIDNTKVVRSIRVSAKTEKSTSPVSNKNQVVINPKPTSTPTPTATVFNPGQTRPNQTETPLYDITYVGEDTLTNVGLSSSELCSLNQAFYKFDPYETELDINPSTVSVAPHDPNSANTSDNMTFSVNVQDNNGMTYSEEASVEYSDITNLSLTLTNTQNNQVFSSGTYNDCAQ